MQAGSQCLGYLAAKRLMTIGHAVEDFSKESFQEQTSSEPESMKLRVLEDGLYWSCLKSEM